MMEVDARTSHHNEKRPLENIATHDKQKMPAEDKTDTTVFVNQAAIAWHESRRKWIGDLSHTSERTPKDPTISWSMTYEDLLSTNDPFTKPIPLTEMVDFLVDIWYDEGLFD
ncbi:hypothetical protein ACJIZ3_022873 [Penstemon smallii]|uniref:Gag1-like clamp domain-containing protein n=1 Tax=Penstemon smallii TaxID=265156 RepID=A0ABD3TPJ5_9LAMI